MTLAEAGPWRAIAVGASVAMVCSLPLFFTGAMAVQLTTELEFGPTQLGASVGAFYAAMAVTSNHLGRFTDRVGAIMSLRLAAVGASWACLGIALLASDWATFVVWLLLAGTSHALAQPAANRLLANRVSPVKLGLAFGFKQSAPPLASMLAGLAVPVIALTVGWRWAFVLAAGLAVAVAGSVGKRPHDRARKRSGHGRDEPLANRGTLIILCVATGLAFAASTSLLGFFVDAAVTARTNERVAGLVLSLASIAAILVRLIAGQLTDRIHLRPLRVCAGLLAAGSAGLGLLTVGTPVAMAFGAVLGLAGTWGFPGLFWFALVRAYPETPGRVTGAIAPAAVGGVVGPIGFGAVADTLSYGVAWTAAALLAFIAAAAMRHGSSQLHA